MYNSQLFNKAGYLSSENKSLQNKLKNLEDLKLKFE